VNCLCGLTGKRCGDHCAKQSYFSGLHLQSGLSSIVFGALFELTAPIEVSDPWPDV
jgi:hypothetical protein